MRLIKSKRIENDDVFWDINVPDTHNYVLASGNVVHNCGFGFSVERQYINEMPEIAEELYPTETTIIVRDSKIGWASALKELISMLYNGQIPKWDVSKVRPAGSRLKTFGGRASGPEPLDRLFRKTVKLFKGAKGRRLNSLECHTLMCHIAASVIVGSVRRSALISLSNLSDDRMKRAKTGQWWVTEPDLALSNNSVAYTEKPDLISFIKEWTNLYQSKAGERGLWNKEGMKRKYIKTGRPDFDGDLIPNPCGEVLLRDTGEGCNLSEIIIRPGDTFEAIMEKAKYATIIGTIQATLTNFRFLRKVWQKNMEEERLLGVSITGIMDHPIMCGLDHDVEKFTGISYINTLEKLLTYLKNYCHELNKEWAGILGINPTGHVTCVKPSGCTILDTKVRTGEGIMSMGYIFENFVDKNVYRDDTSGRWYPLTRKLYAYDKDNTLQLITDFFDNGISEVYEIEDENGEIHKFTGNHKFQLTNGEWVKVENLKEGDDIKSFN